MIDNKIQPFRELAGCPKCGTGETSEHATTFPTPPFPSSFADGSPIPVFAIAASYSPIRTRYCPGGQEPETPGELDPMAATMHAALSSINAISNKQIEFPQVRGKLNICAGISEEHLHATCNNCQYEFLMSTKDAELPGWKASGKGINQIATLHPLEP